MENVILILVIAAILALAVWYIVKAKKSGKKCIGCPDGCSCSSGNSACGGCTGGESCGCGTDHK